MRVLIIGCGYVGAAVGAELTRRGHEVFGLRRGRHEELPAPGIQGLSGDISSPADLEKLPRSFDWVINTVAAGGGGANEYRRVYLEGTRHVLEWLKGQPIRRYVYTSSTSVYGQDDGSIVTEQSPAEPDSETGRVLIETENLLREAASMGFPAIVLRCAGIYGPGRGYWLQQFLRGDAIMEAAGERWLNMIHRDDVAGAILCALERGKAGEVFNVADDEPVQQRTVFQWLAQRLRRPMPPCGPAETASGRRGASNKRVSNRKLRLELACELKYPTFRQGYEAELTRLAG